MPDISFEVTTDLTPVSSTKIETNFEAVRDWLTEELAPYATMVVTPDSISDGKKLRANIRKVGDSIESQRKAIKKLWLRPYEEYEAKCKELTGIVNNAVSNIDGQIKAMENELKEQKRQRLSDFFDENSYDVADFIIFDDIFDPKWLNATFSEQDAQSSILDQIGDIRDGLDTIRTMNSPYETAMLSEYSKTHNLSKAIAEGKRLEAIQRAEEERRAREAENMFSDEEAPMEDHGTPQPAPAVTADTIRPIGYEEPPQPKLFTLSFEVTGTAEAFAALKRCMNANGMTYRKI